nr:MAG TPA: hypothetical protein [Caudoviricetes sp.]
MLFGEFSFLSKNTIIFFIQIFLLRFKLKFLVLDNLVLLRHSLHI